MSHAQTLCFCQHVGTHTLLVSPPSTPTPMQPCPPPAWLTVDPLVAPRYSSVLLGQPLGPLPPVSPEARSCARLALKGKSTLSATRMKRTRGYLGQGVHV
jgi:hypothetical protein